MFPLLILSVTSLSLTLGATNWPVFFEHLGNVHSIHNKWDLSLSIDTRLTEFEVRRKKESIIDWDWGNVLDLRFTIFCPESQKRRNTLT